MTELCVKIYGRQYRLAVSTGEEQLLTQCAEAVDAQMNAIHENGKVMNGDQVAALTALEIAYESVKAETQANQKIKELTDRIAELEAALAARPESGPAPAVSTPGEAALLREIDQLSDMCEKAIFSDMHKGSSILPRG